MTRHEHASMSQSSSSGGSGSRTTRSSSSSRKTDTTATTRSSRSSTSRSTPDDHWLGWQQQQPSPPSPSQNSSSSPHGPQIDDRLASQQDRDPQDDNGSSQSSEEEQAFAQLEAMLDEEEEEEEEKEEDKEPGKPEEDALLPTSRDNHGGQGGATATDHNASRPMVHDAVAKQRPPLGVTGTRNESSPGNFQQPEDRGTNPVSSPLALSSLGLDDNVLDDQNPRPASSASPWSNHQNSIGRPEQTSGKKRSIEDPLFAAHHKSDSPTVVATDVLEQTRRMAARQQRQRRYQQQHVGFDHSRPGAATSQTGPWTDRMSSMLTASRSAHQHPARTAASPPASASSLLGSRGLAVKKAESIVGTRPEHWGRTSRTSRTAATSTAKGNLFLQSRRRFAAPPSKKVAATTTTAAAAESSPKPASRKRALPDDQSDDGESKAEGSDKGTGDKAAPTSPTAAAKNDSSTDAQESQSGERCPSTSSISFAPAFIKHPPALPAITTTSKTANSDSPTETAVFSPRRPDYYTSTPVNDHVSLFSSPPRPGSKSAAGPLSKRLKLLRNAIKGDVLRFQSGQYPFSTDFQGMNDPRHRARSYMDVTILKQHGNDENLFAAMAPHHSSTRHYQQQQKLVTVLAHVHAHVVQGNEQEDHCSGGKETSSSTDKSQQAPLSDATCSSTLPSRMWVCFNPETAREQGLRVGSELRLYNVVFLPNHECSGPNEVDNVRNVVLCTQLCEPYPAAVLPQLPKVY